MTWSERVDSYKATDINGRINAKSWIALYTKDCFVIEQAIVELREGLFFRIPCHADMQRKLIYKQPWLNIKRSARRICPPSVHRRMAREFKRKYGFDIDEVTEDEL